MRLVIRLVLLLALVLSAATVSPLALADDPSASPTPSAAAGSPSAGSADRRAADPVITTTITAHPINPSTSATATFSYAADVPHAARVDGVQFTCSLTGPKLKAIPTTCPVDAVSGPTTTGTVTYKKLKASRTRYTFTVTAALPAGLGGNTSTSTVQGSTARFSWHVFDVYAPGHYSPSSGASFNRPLTPSRRRTNLTRIINTVNAMPGYKQGYPGLCPAPGASTIPGTIRMSMYSLVDGRVARALVAAHKRCLSVQVLMNDHLSRNTDPAWRTLENALGTKTSPAKARSFAHRCHRACRGGGVLHTKMFLFDSTIPSSSRNKIVKTVFFGSSNMTSNASDVQYNDLYGVRNDTSGLYSQFRHMFDLMKKDDGYHRNKPLPAAGKFQATFWPQPKGSTDTYLTGLRAISCSGANGGTGIGGHTVVYINMHAWFGTRGLALANKVRSLYSQGCYVRVLYSFMSYAVFKKLHSGTGSRMSVRRTIFSHNGHVAYVYSHFKNISISGHVGSDRSSKIVYTGSNNFTNEGLNFDEVTVRIKSAAAYNQYVGQFKYMSHRLSSAVYANFSEPTGGGRAPAKRTTVTQAPAGTPTIESPAVTGTDDGRMTVVD